MNNLVVSSYYRPAFTYGGPVESIHKRSLALARLGHRFTTYTTNANGNDNLDVPLGQPVMVDGIPVWYFCRWWFTQLRKPPYLFFSPEMKRRLGLLKSGNFDLVLIHSVWGDPGRMAATAARKAGIPYIYYTHGCFEPWALSHNYYKKRIYFELIEKRILRGAAGIVACNTAEIDELHRLGIRVPIERIPWGVELPNENRPKNHMFLEKLVPNIGNRPFILFLSRLHPKKGLNLLISAFASLSREFPDWLLVLAGPDEGGTRGYLQRQVIELGMEKHIIFAGMVTGAGKETLLEKAKFLVLPSFSEGFPMAVVEALAYSLPVVITTGCYLPEVSDFGAGLVVNPESQCLKRALQEMMRDERLRQICSNRAIGLAQNKFSWTTVGLQTQEFYRRVL